MASSVNMFSPSVKKKCLEAVGRLQKQTLLAVDCEGIQLGKAGPLTLLQIGTADGSVYLFDVIENEFDVMKNEVEQDKSFFKETGLDVLLTSPDIVKVFHSCSGDSAALFYQFEIKLENVFDTQVAHVIIEEHKGSKMPLRKKLEEICKIYSDSTAENEWKDDVQKEFLKKDGTYWAKRPLTQEMINYASRDVTGLIPEVYKNQRRYLEENGLMDTFRKRVEEEIELETDTVNKERRKNRRDQIKKEILVNMCRKYGEGVELAALTVDERRALDETRLSEISSAKYPDAIRALKLNSLTEFLKSIEDELVDPDNFIPKPHMMFKLGEIMSGGTKAMQKDSAKVRKLINEIATNDIERKYNEDIPLTYLSSTDFNILKNLRPLYDNASYPDTVLKLHWRIVEDDLDKDIEKLSSDPEYEVGNVQKLIRFIRDKRVPENIKSKAKEARKRNEDGVLERFPHKYDLESSVNELTETEKIVLDRLNVIDNDYHPVIEFLHWEVTFVVLCKEYEDFKSGKFSGIDYISRKLDFLITNERVPDKIKEKAIEFQRKMSQKKGRGKKQRK